VLGPGPNELKYEFAQTSYVRLYEHVKTVTFEVEENKKGNYNQEKKEASYTMQKEARDKGNKHTNNLYSTKIYNVF